MNNWLLLPPVTFLVVLAGVWFLSRLLNIFSARRSERLTEPYSCGEEFEEHLIQPDYSQFFPYAFFFTILHVVAMIIATVPTETPDIFGLAVAYMATAAIGLLILLRR
jgi:NADH:ubiquinone oxidoreductase subunit 3 (subunit A)